MYLFNIYSIIWLIKYKKHLLSHVSTVIAFTPKRNVIFQVAPENLYTIVDNDKDTLYADAQNLQDQNTKNPFTFTA